MIFHLLFFSLSIDSSYNLIPPLVPTNISEVGNWTLCGTATNLKKSIRLVSNLDGQFGRVCLRVPTSFVEWAAEVELSIRGGNGGGKDGGLIFLFFTSEVCPTRSGPFKGFAIVIDTATVISSGGDRLPVYFVEGEIRDWLISQQKPAGFVERGDAAREGGKLSLHLTRSMNHIVLESSFSSVVFKRVFESAVKDELKFGYFSIASLTGEEEKGTNSIDLVSFRLYQMSDFGKTKSKADYSAINRAIIANMKRERHDKKNARRMLKMPTVMKLLDVINKTSNDETKQRETGKFGLDDAVRVVGEMERRLKNSTVSVADLSSFIDQKVEKTIEKAYSKIEVATQKLEESRSELGELWANLRTQMLGLAVEAATEMKRVQSEALEIAKNAEMVNFDRDSVQLALNSQIDSNESVIDRFLIVISLIEIICYALFFFIKHQETHGFKKRD